MKKILILLPPLLLSFAGCRSSKTTTKEAVTINRTIDSTVNDHVVIHSITTDRSLLTIRTTLREYDTSKPVDKTTGKPPMKSETINEQSVLNNIKSDYKSDAKKENRVKGKLNSKQTVQTTQVKNRSPSLRIIGLFTLLFLIIIVVIRFRPFLLSWVKRII